MFSSEGISHKENGMTWLMNEDGMATTSTITKADLEAMRIAMLDAQRETDLLVSCQRSKREQWKSAIKKREDAEGKYNRACQIRNQSTHV